MALGLVLVGILAGLVSAGTVLVLGGGLGFAALAYVSGGLAGVLGGLTTALLPPRHRVAVIVAQDHG